jgi:hypothetical protein
MSNKNLSNRQLLAATACVLLSTAAGANALAGTEGYLIDAASWDAGVFNLDLDVQKYFYLRTVEDLAAASADGYVLLQNPVNSVSPAVMKTYTSAGDIAAIKAWLEAQPDQNATGVQISTTDDVTVDPGSVDTATWTSAGINLQPFSVTSACDTAGRRRVSRYVLRDIRHARCLRDDADGRSQGLLRRARGDELPRLRVVSLGRLAEALPRRLVRELPLRGLH